MYKKIWLTCILSDRSATRRLVKYLIVNLLYKSGVADLHEFQQVGYTMWVCVQIICGDRQRLFREETFLDEFLGDLDCVGCSSLAEVVGNAPEVEAGLY